MKVDKAVCTNETMEDLYRAIRYETVFTALVENKILAIKRECDERQRLKKNRAHSFKLNGLLSSKKICCVKHDSLTNVDLVPNRQPNSKCSNVNEVVGDEKVKGGDSDAMQFRILSQSDVQKSDDYVSCAQENSIEGTHDDKIQIHESESICSDKSKKITFQSGLIDDKHKAYKSHNFRRKPSVESNFSQNSSSVLESYMSDDGCNKKSRVISSETLSSNQNKISLHETTAILDHERQRLRILEARSISAQCSPVFPRPSRNHSIATQIPCLTEDNQLVPLKLLRPQHPQYGIDAPSDNVALDASKDKATSFVCNTSRNSTDHDIIRLDKTKFPEQFDTKQGFITSFNQLTSQNQTLPVITTIKSKKDALKLHRLMNSSSVDIMTDSKCASKSRRKDDKFGMKTAKFNENSDGSEVSCSKRKHHKRSHKCSDPLLIYPSSNGFQHCILSMPPNQPLQLQYDENVVFDVSLQMDGNRNGDLEVIMPSHRKHKHRYRHHHHHHHHHHHSKKVGKRKILVHDIDHQSVKVIDPDDLPQRARWTIIATACLLLILCLLLVGVTLRMAPFIDDMVRQENERLMQESFNRAKFARNFTETAPLAASEESP